MAAAEIPEGYDPIHRWLWDAFDARRVVSAAVLEDPGASFREVCDDLYFCDGLLVDSFRAALFEESRSFERYAAERGAGGGPNSMNRGGAILKDMGLEHLTAGIIKSVVERAAAKHLPEFVTLVGSREEQRHGEEDGQGQEHGGTVRDPGSRVPVSLTQVPPHAFTVSYGVRQGEQKGLDFHVDDADVTLNICLGSSKAHGAHAEAANRPSGEADAPGKASCCVKGPCAADRDGAEKTCCRANDEDGEKTCCRANNEDGEKTCCRADDEDGGASDGPDHTEHAGHSDRIDQGFSGGEIAFGGLRCDNCQSTPVIAAEFSKVPSRGNGALLHAGRLRHEALPLDSGDRTNLIVWCRDVQRSDPDRLDAKACPMWCGGRAVCYLNGGNCDHEYHKDGPLLDLD